MWEGKKPYQQNNSLGQDAHKDQRRVLWPTISHRTRAPALPYQKKPNWINAHAAVSIPTSSSYDLFLSPGSLYYWQHPQRFMPLIYFYPNQSKITHTCIIKIN